MLYKTPGTGLRIRHDLENMSILPGSALIKSSEALLPDRNYQVNTIFSYSTGVAILAPQYSVNCNC
jgi:hypothetical protein